MESQPGSSPAAAWVQGLDQVAEQFTSERRMLSTPFVRVTVRSGGRFYVSRAWPGPGPAHLTLAVTEHGQPSDLMDVPPSREGEAPHQVPKTILIVPVGEVVLTEVMHEVNRAPEFGFTPSR